ncbi:MULTISPECIES: hypothetical protein [unclassified Flavobacterium]|uniref:hypothetical protein n=1 Tax=unclassified Flavobacterium TaxID=196869 RepID=UPI00131B4C44|nr:MULTISPECIES: hypothetical protein [unclassified Flavobacterium]
MEQAAILKSGIVVKLTNLTKPTYTIYGFLNSFETVIDGVTKKFRETVVTDFKEEDQKNKDAIGGFYEEQFFLEYLTDKNKLYQLKDHYYKFKLATVDDEINVKKLKVIAPYTDFCKIETYKWIYKPNISVIDNGTEQIIIPSGLDPAPLLGENIQLNSNAMQFYSHKIRLFVTPLTDINVKQAKALLLAKIAIRISQIESILNLFDLDTYTDFGYYINSQKSEWSTQPIFANPTIEVLEDYMRNLTNFYKSFYVNQIKIQKAPKEEKFYWLARCLSAEALATVPTYEKVNLLEKISDYSHQLTEINEGESLAIKIIKSFTFDSVSAADRNELLRRLMLIQVYQVPTVYNQINTVDTKQTLFEILYSKIDDNRSGRYTIGPLAYTFGLLDTKDNRTEFTLMLYKIWKSSKYNPKYADPSYTLPKNVFGIYPESYYMKLIADAGNSSALTAYYNPETSPAILVYNTTNTSYSDNHLNTTDVNYIIGDFEGKKIKIRKQERVTTTEFDYEKYDYSQEVNITSPIYGTYDLYQPISIIGFKPNLDLLETFKDPETKVAYENDRFLNIPVFFLYYMQDYSNLKKIDFGIVGLVEVAMNLSGIGALADLKYLGYLSKARSVWTGTATASETVLFWKAVDGVNNTVQFTADNLASINSYTNNTSTDQDVKEFTDKVSVVFDYISMGALVTDPIMKRKLFDAAAEVIAQERKLILLGKSHGLDTHTMDAIKAIYDIQSLIGLMQLKLDNLPSHASDNILTRFSTFTDDEKYDFFAYFYNLKEEAKWKEMNFQHSRVVNGITQQYTLVDIWKNEIIYLKNQRTVEFLEGVNIVRNDSGLLKHIHDGDFEIKLRGGNSIIGEPKITGSHNINILRKTPVTSAKPLLKGEIYWVDPPPKYSKPNDILNSYQQGKIERNMSDLTDPHTGLPFEKGNGSSIATKKGENVYFPISYSTERINEEMAYALSQIDRSKPYDTKIGADGSYSFYYRGRASDGHILEIIYLSTTNNKNTAILQTIYPVNF